MRQMAMSRLCPGVIGVLALWLCMTGCAIYRPKPPIKNSAVANQMLADISKADLLKEYNGLPESSTDEKAKKISRRNQIVNELVFLVDQSYYSFENHFYGSQAAFNVSGDAVNLGLTGVSAVTGSAHLKSVLSAIATGTTGLKTSVDKNFFDQQTRAAIVQKMRAARATQLATMQDEHHMKGNLSDYSLETALADVYSYYDAGTVVGALQNIAQAAGTEQKTAVDQQKVNSAKKQSIQ
jgi:hypothetical protein